MKNYVKNTLPFLPFLLCILVPFSLSGQEKKSEQKIKIITDNGSGKKVMIDTVFTGKSPDSLILKDGSVVYIRHDGDDQDIHDHHGKKSIIVSASSGKEDDGEMKEITIIQADSSSNGNALFFSNSDNEPGNIHYKIIKKSEDPGDMQIFYVNKDRKDNDGSAVYFSQDEKDSGIDKSRFVIAKDGMVVTVEGTDEAKTKELVKQIEKTLGVNNESK
jgi:hypothetical protein